jgi:hypothetical protein
MNTTTRNYLTLGEFVATRREVDDTGLELGFDAGDGVSRRGYIYADCCFVDRHKDIETGEETGEFWTIVERSDWLDRDLAKLERILWAEHYLFETENVALDADDGTLSDFVAAICDSHAKPCDGDLFGVLFSEAGRTWSPGEARAVIVGALYPKQAGGVGVQSAPSTGGVGVQSGGALVLSDAELTNLITACKTSAMRKDSPEWQAGLDAIADKLYAARDA